MAISEITPGAGVVTAVIESGKGRLADESEVNVLGGQEYFNNVAFDVNGPGGHVVFSHAQDREDFVAELNERPARDMTVTSNW